MTYKCTDLCKKYKIGGDSYVGTPRTNKKRQFVLKYCMTCDVYFDTDLIRCECCKTALRVGFRNKSMAKVKQSPVNDQITD